MEPIKVYIAGAITPTGGGNHAIEFLENIRRGINFSIYFLTRGFLPFCPMLDFQYFLAVNPGTLTSKMIYDLSIGWMKECDVVFLLPKSENSKGWKRERRIIRKEKIPIFTSPAKLIEARDRGDIICR